MLCNQILDRMSNLNINESESPLPHILQLPLLSAQACPITFGTKENSVLTKRISYSENLKDRPFMQLSKAASSDRSIEESIVNNSGSAETNDEEYTKTKKRHSMQLFRRKSLSPQNYVSSSSSAEENNSFKECQQIFAKIHQRFSHKSLRKSSVRMVSSRGEINKDIFPRRKRKQTLCTAVLLKNDVPKRNIALNPCCKSIKKQSGHFDDTKKKIQEKDINQNLELTVLKNIYKQPFRYNTDKQIHHKVKQIKKTKVIEKDSQVSSAKTVYYSEKQSVVLDGVPCVPPSTPHEMNVKEIASLSDLKSQRSIQQKLKYIRKKQKKREIELLEAAKAKEMEREIIKRKELIDTQRRQIYAINKVLANLEHDEFETFKAEMKGMPV